MCDVGETRVLANGTSPSVLISSKLRRPSCDEQHQQTTDKQACTSSPSRSTPSTPTSLRRTSSLEKCFSDPEFFRKQRQRQNRSHLNGTTISSINNDKRSTSSNRKVNNESTPDNCNHKDSTEYNRSISTDTTCTTDITNSNGNEVITNGASKSCESDECDGF